MSGNSGGPTMRATPPPPPCSLQNELTGALDFKFLLGIAAKLARIDFGASLYKSLTTGNTGGQMAAQAGLFGVTVDRPTPPGGSITGGAEPAQILVNAGSFQRNLTTGQSAFAKDKTFKFGGAIGIGFEIDFDPKAFKDIDLQNQACRRMGGG